MRTFFFTLLLVGCNEMTPCPEGQACGNAATPAPSPTTMPAGFTAADHVVPVQLDPDRPQPKPPTHFDVARDEERVPPDTQR